MQKFATSEERDKDERILLFLSGVSREFPEDVVAYTPPKYSIPQRGQRDMYRGSPDSSLQRFFTDGLTLDHRVDSTLPLYETFFDGRIDFRNWYTLTIDGADARDLDDALSIARYPDGDILL